MIEWLREEAARERRSLSQEVVFILEKGIEKIKAAKGVQVLFAPRIKTATALCWTVALDSCGEEDLNLHTSRHQHLKRVIHYDRIFYRVFPCILCSLSLALCILCILNT